MKILVTGGSGFIGTNLIAALSVAGHTIFNYDLKQGFDILDYELLRTKASGMDAIIHLAAKVKVQECEQNPAETILTNTIGTENVFRAAAEKSIKKVLVASSAAVYGNNQSLPLREDAQAMPINIYGVSKAAAEKIAVIFSEKYKQKINCFRIFNVYGPHQHASSQYSAVIPIFIAHAMRDEDLTIYGNGTQTRDFIFIKDVVNTFSAALQSEFNETIVNVASSRPVSVLDLAQAIISLTGSKSKIKFEKSRQGDIANSHADVSKMNAIATAQYALEEGLKETIDWFKHARIHSNNTA